ECLAAPRARRPVQRDRLGVRRRSLGQPTLHPMDAAEVAQAGRLAATVAGAAEEQARLIVVVRGKVEVAPLEAEIAQRAVGGGLAVHPLRAAAELQTQPVVANRVADIALAAVGVGQAEMGRRAYPVRGLPRGPQRGLADRKHVGEVPAALQISAYRVGEQPGGRW